jgi:hypothetical protein
MWDRVFVVQGDTAPYVRKTLRDASGPVSLASGVTSVTFSMREVNSATPKVTNQGCTIVQVGAVDVGVVEYRWATNDTDTAGIYVAEFTVNYAGGAKATFPSPQMSSLIIFVRPQIA